MSDLAAFISYSHRDQAFVTALARALEAAEREIWVDEDDIPPGAPWRAASWGPRSRPLIRSCSS